MSTDEQIALLQKNFDEVARQDGISGVEFWYARDLQSLLGYAQWRNFSEVVEKAKVACRTAGFAVANHFADVSKMVCDCKTCCTASDFRFFYNFRKITPLSIAKERLQIARIPKFDAAYSVLPGDLVEIFLQKRNLFVCAHEKRLF